MAFPFLLVAAAFGGGICFSFFVHFSLLIYIPALISTLFISLYLFVKKKQNAALVVILISFFLGGAAHLADRNRRWDEHSLQNFQTDGYVDLSGVLYKSPSRGLESDRIFLRADKLWMREREIPVRARVMISVHHSPSLLRVRKLLTGDRVRVSAQIRNEPGFRNFKTASSGLLLKIQKIHAKAYVKSPLLILKTGSGSRLSPLRWISRFRRALLDRLQTIFPGPGPFSISKKGAVIEALLLGERGRLHESTIQSLQQAGLFHLFAISGAHVGIISFLLFGLFAFLKIPTRISSLLLMFFLGIYACLVEGRTPVMRATIMALAYLLGKVLNRDVNLINTLSMSACILLLADPFQLLSVGFQLTFAATLSIILFYPKVKKKIPTLPLKTGELLALSFTAQLAVLPLVARSFNRVALSSLFLNCFAVPLIAVIMGLGFILMGVSFFSQAVTSVLALFLRPLVDLLCHIPFWLRDVSFLSFRVPTPPLWVVMGYLFCLFVCPFLFRKKTGKRLAFVCFSVFLAVLVFYPFPSLSQHLRMTLLDVGQGESILIEFPGSRKMLIDGGGFYRGRFDVGEKIVSRFLWNKGIKTLDYLVLTHGHPDHLLGLISVAKNFHIREYWEAYHPLDDLDYERFRKALGSRVTRRHVFRGQEFKIEEVDIQAFYPPILRNTAMVSVQNNQSLVLRFSYGRVSFLMTGDIEKRAEDDLVKGPYQLKSLVLKVPHHGSRTSSTASFLKAVSPEFAVISAGRNNIYGFPDQEVLSRYKQAGALVFRTDRDGAIALWTDGKRVGIRTASGRQMNFLSD